MRRSVKRGLVAVLVVSLAVAGLAAVLWRLYGLAFAELIIAESLAEQGVPVSALTLRSAGTRSAVLTDLRVELAGGVTVRRVEAEYRLSDLIWNRHLERLVVSGVQFEASVPALADDGAAMAPPGDLPVGQIVIEDVEVAIATPVGRLAIALALEAETTEDGGVALSGRTLIGGEPGEVEMPFAGTVSPAGAFDLGVTTKGGRLGWRGTVFDLRDGSLTLAGTFAGIAGMAADLAADVTLPDGSTARLGAVGRLADESGHLDLVLEPGSTLGRFAATAAVDGWGGPAPALDLTLDADMPQLRRMAELVGLDSGWASSATATARLSGAWEDGAEILNAPFAGELALAADFASADAEDRLTLDISGVVDADGGSVRLRGQTPWRVDWRPANSEGVALTLGEDAGGIFDARLERAGSGWTLAVAGPYRMAAGHGPFAGAVKLSASIDAVDDGMAGRFAIGLDGSGALPGAVSVWDGRADIAGRLAFDGSRWRVWSESCQPAIVGRLTIGGRLVLPEGLSACLSPIPDRPLLEIATAPWDGAEVAAGLRIDPAVMSLGEEGGHGPGLELDRLEAAISARLDRNGAVSAKIAAVDAALRLPAEAVAVDEVRATLTAVPDADPRMRLVVESAVARSLRKPAWFVPLRMTGDAMLGDDGLMQLSGTARAVAGDLVAALGGRHDLSTGAGRVDISLEPLAFTPGARQPADILPALGDMPVGDFAGTVSASAGIGWGERLTSSAAVRLEDVALTALDAGVRGIDGTLHADSLLPLNLPDGQLLAIGGAEFGVTLAEGAVSFGLAGDRLRVQGIGFGLAGGSVAVEPFEAAIGDREIPVVITMQGVDLEELSKQFIIEGLSVTGHLDGRVPVRLIEDTISIEDGVLQTTGPGVIRYVAALPIGPQGEGGVDLLMSAVQNFHYESLRATLNGRTGEDLEMAIQLTGANPELYDGFPIALNVNLSGALDQVLRSGFRSMAIADDATDLLRGD